MSTTYYKSGSGFIAVTSESPKGFKGVVFVGKGGQSLTTITEQAFSVQQLHGLPTIPLSQVPVEWVEAFGYDRVEELPIFDIAGDNLLDIAKIAVPTVPRDPACGIAAIGCLTILACIVFGIFLAVIKNL